LRNRQKRGKNTPKKTPPPHPKTPPTHKKQQPTTNPPKKPKTTNPKTKPTNTPKTKNPTVFGLVKNRGRLGPTAISITLRPDDHRRWTSGNER